MPNKECSQRCLIRFLCVLLETLSSVFQPHSFFGTIDATLSEAMVPFQAPAPVWPLTSSLQSTSLLLCLSNRRDPAGQKQGCRTSSANGGLRTREPSKWSVPASAMESAVNSGVRKVLLSFVISTIAVITCHLVSSWSHCVFLPSHRWTGSSVWRQLGRSALCVSLHLQGKDLPLLYLCWTQWWTAVVLHLLWLWDRSEIFFLHREEWWALHNSI